MALDDIIAKIQTEATGRSEAILAEARDQVEEKLASARERAAEMKAERLRRAERDATAARLRTLALARLGARDMVLACKQSAVDRVFDGVTDRVRGLGGESYADLLEKLLAARASGEQELLPAPADAGTIDEAFVARANERLRGKGVSLRLGPPAEGIDRGFVLRQGRILVDSSLATLISEARERLESEVYNSLFGGDGEASG